MILTNHFTNYVTILYPAHQGLLSHVYSILVLLGSTTWKRTPKYVESVEIIHPFIQQKFIK